MDTEMIKEMAESVNNVVLATAKPYQEQIRQLQAENKHLRKACEEARLLYDHLALSSLEAAVRFGDNYEPPTDKDCLRVRELLEQALKD